MERKEKFLCIYANLPLGVRKEIVLVLDDNDPITWEVANIEVSNDTPVSKVILEKLEKIADSFPGVGKAYAIQAGREIRVMVEPDRISDAEAASLARDLSKKIEEQMEYPGQIKVTVIRETRAVDYAK